MAGKWYIKISVNTEGFNGNATVSKNRGLGTNVKRMILFKSLNKKYMSNPARRVVNDNMAYKRR